MHGFSEHGVENNFGFGPEPKSFRTWKGYEELTPLYDEEYANRDRIMGSSGVRASTLNGESSSGYMLSGGVIC